MPLPIRAPQVASRRMYSEQINCKITDVELHALGCIPMYLCCHMSSAFTDTVQGRDQMLSLHLPLQTPSLEHPSLSRPGVHALHHTFTGALVLHSNEGPIGGSHLCEFVAAQARVRGTAAAASWVGGAGAEDDGGLGALAELTNLCCLQVGKRARMGSQLDPACRAGVEGLGTFRVYCMCQSHADRIFHSAAGTHLASSCPLAGPAGAEQLPGSCHQGAFHSDSPLRAEAGWEGHRHPVGS